MFILLTDIQSREYRLTWWQIRALATEGKLTTVYVNIDGRSLSFEVEKPGKEIEAEVERHKATMDVAA
jgi:hypothetical protein